MQSLVRVGALFRSVRRSYAGASAASEALTEHLSGTCLAVGQGGCLEIELGSELCGNSGVPPPLVRVVPAWIDHCELRWLAREGSASEQGAEGPKASPLAPLLPPTLRLTVDEANKRLRLTGSTRGGSPTDAGGGAGPGDEEGRADGPQSSLASISTSASAPASASASFVPGSFLLEATVPQQFSVDITLARGDVVVAEKLEGECSIATAEGGIEVKRELATVAGATIAREPA